MAKKIILIVLGLLGLLIGLALAAFGGAGLAFGGSSGVVQTGYHSISTPTSGFVSNPGDIQNSNDVGRNGGSVTLQLDGRDTSKPVFLGIGPAAQVQAYFNGASYEQVTKVDFGDFRLVTTRIDGTTQPAAPGDQTFWVASATGTSPQLRWPIANGDYRLVIMNADASPGVSLDARAGLKIKGLFGLALGATIFGGLLALLGLGLLIWGIAAKRSRQITPAYPGGYPAGYPPAGTPANQPGGGWQPPPGGYPPAPGSAPPPPPPPPPGTTTPMYPPQPPPGPGTPTYPPQAPPPTNPPEQPPPTNPPTNPGS